MKQTLLTTIFVVLTVLQVAAQNKYHQDDKKTWMDGGPPKDTTVKPPSTDPYKPLSAFGNDTIAFFHHNFNLRADQYIGKTIGDVLKDAQIKPKYFIVGSSIYEGQVNGIMIYFNGNIRQSPTPKDIYIYISNARCPLQMFMDLLKVIVVGNGLKNMRFFLN